MGRGSLATANMALSSDCRVSAAVPLPKFGRCEACEAAAPAAPTRGSGPRPVHVTAIKHPASRGVQRPSLVLVAERWDPRRRRLARRELLQRTSVVAGSGDCDGDSERARAPADGGTSGRATSGGGPRGTRELRSPGAAGRRGEPAHVPLRVHPRARSSTRLARRPHEGGRGGEARGGTKHHRGATRSTFGGGGDMGSGLCNRETRATTLPSPRAFRRAPKPGDRGAHADAGMSRVSC